MCLRDGGCSSPTTSCDTPATLRRSSARGAPGLHRRSASCPICIAVTSPTPRSAKARTKRASGTATSWAGRCLGTRPGLARNSLGRTPGGHDAHRLLPPTRNQCLREFLDVDARRRGDGQQLPAARPDRLRAAGDVGGLADRLATTGGREAAYAYRWTPNLSVVSPEGRAVRRPRHWQPLTSFLHHSDWHLRALTCSPREGIHAPTRLADAPPHVDAVQAPG